MQGEPPGEASDGSASEEQRALLHDLEAAESCPRGRPTFFHLALDSLGRSLRLGQPGPSCLRR